MSHPSLGLPPLDHRAGDPDSAAALVADRRRLGERALRYAMDADPTFADRYPPVDLEQLRLDLDSIVVRLADAVGAGQPGILARWAEMVAPRYRKRAVPMDDVVALLEGLRRAASSAALPESVAPIDDAIDAATAVFRWHRRLAGDARKRNALLAFLYKGA